jgi:glucose-1-phosphate thymidylyltransferase
MLIAGATRICFVISPGKSDIVSYYGGGIGDAAICYAVQQQPNGLCDAIFHALPFIAPDEHVLVGLPDTVWFPDTGFEALGDDDLSFLCFPVERPEFFDAVVMDEHDNVLEVQVKSAARRRTGSGARSSCARRCSRNCATSGSSAAPPITTSARS